MSSADLARMALELPPEERLGLARRLPSALLKSCLGGIRPVSGECAPPDAETGRLPGWRSPIADPYSVTRPGLKI
jgi:hypothetical protein